MSTTTSSSRALDVYRPFTRAQAEAAGISYGRLRGPSYRRLFRNVYLHRDVVLRPTVYVEAALLIHGPTAFASHFSAAVIWDLPVPDDHRVHISVLDKADRRRRDGIRHHLAGAGSSAGSGAAAGVVTRHGARVSSPSRLFLEMAEVINLVELVVLGDAMVKRGLVTVAELREAATSWAGRGADLARRAAGYVREGVDSPMESRLRMLIVLAGLPEPEVNVVVRRADGSVNLRFDLCYPALRLVVEYDGRQHRDDLDQWDRDLARADWFDDGSWRVVKVVARGIYRRPDETIGRVHNALSARGCPGLPRTLSDEWRAYFPVRA